MADMTHISVRVDAGIMSAIKQKARERTRQFGFNVTASDMLREALREFAQLADMPRSQPKEEKTMAFISAQKLLEECGRPASNRSRASSEISFATDITRTHSGKNPDPIYSVRFSLSQEIIKKARFMPGDKVDILFDPERNAGLIKRTSSGGWALSQTNSSPRIAIKFTWRPGLPTIANTAGCTEVQVTDEGIMFRFPEGTMFDRNARAETQATEVPTRFSPAPPLRKLNGRQLSAL